MNLKNVTQAKGSKNVLNRISVCGKSLIGEGLPSPKPCLANVRLMSATFQKMSHRQTESITCFGLFIDYNRVIFSNETNKLLDIYDTSTKTAELVYTLRSDGHHVAFVMHNYSMKRIYVTFGNLVVQYEIKGLGLQFVKIERF